MQVRHFKLPSFSIVGCSYVKELKSSYCGIQCIIGFT